MKKILINCLINGIGNALMITPLLELASKKFGQKVDILVYNSISKNVFVNNPYVDKVIVFEPKKVLWFVLKHIGKYDLIVSPDYSVLTILMKVLLPRKLMTVTPLNLNVHRKFLFDFSFLGNSVYKTPADEHETLTNCRALDSNIKKEQISKPKIYLSHYEKENSAKIIAGIKKNKKDFLVGFHIGSSAKQTWKRYPLEKFIRICEMALEQIPTARIVLLGSNQELGLMREFKQNLVRCDKRFSSKIIIFQGDMRELFELISQLDLVVGNDSGLVHVAAALGRYNLSFFGPTNNKRISPLTKSIHLFVNLPCRPCFNNPSSKYRPDRCPFNYRCLTQISEKKAFDEIRKIAKTLGKYKHL